INKLLPCTEPFRQIRWIIPLRGVKGSRCGEICIQHTLPPQDVRKAAARMEHSGLDRIHRHSGDGCDFLIGTILAERQLDETSRLAGDAPGLWAGEVPNSGTEGAGWGGGGMERFYSKRTEGAPGGPAPPLRKHIEHFVMSDRQKPGGRATERWIEASRA